MSEYEKPAVVNLGTEREQRREGYFGVSCPNCGGAWFNAAVAIDQDWHVTAYADVSCRECGMTVVAMGADQ